MKTTALTQYAANEIQQVLYDWREHLKQKKTLKKLFFELESNLGMVLGFDASQTTSDFEPCRYSTSKHDGFVMCHTTDIPFALNGWHVSDAYVRIKQFCIPNPTERRPNGVVNVFEAFLQHEQMQKTCELQNFALWW